MRSSSGIAPFQISAFDVAAMLIKCLMPGKAFFHCIMDFSAMMRSLTGKSPQTGDQNLSNANQSRAGRAFAEPVIAFLENNPNNFRVIRRSKGFDVELIPFETRAEDAAALLKEDV